MLEIDSQQYQIRRTHEPRSQWDQLDAEFLAAVKSKMPHRKPLGWDSPPSDASSHKKRCAGTPCLELAALLGRKVQVNEMREIKRTRKMKKTMKIQEE